MTLCIMFRGKNVKKRRKALGGGGRGVLLFSFTVWELSGFSVTLSSWINLVGTHPSVESWSVSAWECAFVHRTVRTVTIVVITLRKGNRQLVSTCIHSNLLRLYCCTFFFSFSLCILHESFILCVVKMEFTDLQITLIYLLIHVHTVYVKW